MPTKVKANAGRRRIRSSGIRFLTIFLGEHWKLSAVIFGSMVACFMVFLYLNPPTTNQETVPIQYLPRQLGSWQGQKCPTEVPLKNKLFNSTTYQESQSGFTLNFISYQRRNEKNGELHYPEDCLRAIGITKMTSKVVPLVINNSVVIFKRVEAAEKEGLYLQYYTVFTSRGGNLVYKNSPQDIQKLIWQKLDFKRSEDQLFKFFCFIPRKDQSFNKMADTKILEFINLIPPEYWPLNK